MKRTVVAMTAAAILIIGLSGCGTKERDELRAKVATLEQQLTQANNDLAAKETELSTLRDNLQTAQNAQTQAQAKIDSLNAELTHLKAAAKAKPKTKAATTSAKKK